MCEHVPVEPCQPLIRVCIAEEKFFEPTAKRLKGKYAFILRKEIINGFVCVRSPHSLKVEVSRCSNCTVDCMIDLIWRRCVRTEMRGNSGETAFYRGNERGDTRRFIAAIEAEIGFPS